MRTALLLILCWLLASPLRADQTNLIIAVDDAAHSNATLKTATPTTIGLSTPPSSSAPSGVTTNRPYASNVKGNSPFAAYDKKLIRSVQKRWYALVDQFGLTRARAKITAHFQLFEDGHVGNLKITKGFAGHTLRLACEKAITESAPFDPLTADLRALAGKTPRNIEITFYY